MNPLHESYEILRNLISELNAHEKDYNEAQTRFHIIDTILEECLNWKGMIEVESYESNSGFTDFELGSPRKVIVEAKKEGVSFDIPSGRSIKNTMPIKSLILANPNIKIAMEQVQNYSSNRGVPISIITNGHQYIAFISSRTDGVSVLDGNALTFISLQDILNNFTLFWECLSSQGIDDNKLMRQLTVGDVRLPSKLSNQLINYPKILYSSELQTSLRQLSELFIQDIVEDPGLEASFYKQCYCESGPLNQYSLLSKSILNSRYASIFSENERQPSVYPINEKNKSNLDESIFSDAISRRPIVLVGDVGVGKTSFIKNLIHNSASNEFKKAIYIYIDLGSKATLNTDIKNLILNEISNQLYEKYKVNIEESAFVKRLYGEEINKFERGIYGELKNSNPDLFKEKLIEKLYSLQEDKKNHIQKSVEFISKEHRKQIIICIDNADQRNFDIQQDAFIISQELSKEWSAIVFLSVRPQTFYKSKHSGALNAYPHKIFTISPPRIDEMISKRLRYAVRLARGEEVSPLNNASVTSENLALFLEVLISSLQKNKELNEFLANITGGNIRKVIEFVTGFIGSPNIDAEKIIDLQEEQGRYIIPLHEFTKQALLGDYSHYSQETSSSMNVLDLTTPDQKEHFLVPLLISYLGVKGDHLDKNSFCRYTNIITEFQNTGFTQKQIDDALRRTTNRKLIETSLRVTFEEDEDRVLIGEMPDSFRITTIGAYHIKKWLGDFAYLDAMLFDTPILVPNVREHLSQNISSMDIKDRFFRALEFRRYLLQSWKQFIEAPSYFNFEEICLEQNAGFERVKQHLLTTRKVKNEDLIDCKL
ncbi:P-loop NTPase fold protein [Proteus columbae]|uniref:P-loop NTPase fold protein n=1 Tax=Proteus columbae TaxID=1987580 RepID=UPI00288C3C11|nr:P-loop NTPase fold protein [Proteus columbae]